MDRVAEHGNVIVSVQVGTWIFIVLLAFMGGAA